MSANNWRYCPQCLKTYREARDDAFAAVKRKYGVASAEEYEKLLAKAKNMPEYPKEQSLRVDYSIGVDESGEFNVTYCCICETCEFTFDFRYSHGTMDKA